jgi:hypothetical protein
MTFSLSLPYLGGGSRGNLTLALLPLHLFAWGGGCGWLGSPLSFILAIAQGGGRGQGTAPTKDNPVLVCTGVTIFTTKYEHSCHICVLKFVHQNTDI